MSEDFDVTSLIELETGHAIELLYGLGEKFDPTIPALPETLEYGNLWEVSPLGRLHIPRKSRGNWTVHSTFEVRSQELLQLLVWAGKYHGAETMVQVLQDVRDLSILRGANLWGLQVGVPLDLSVLEKTQQYPRMSLTLECGGFSEETYQQIVAWNGLGMELILREKGVHPNWFLQKVWDIF